MQRRLERQIRKQKRLRDAYKSAGLTEDAEAANIKLRRLNTKYKEFSKAAGLPEQRERLKVLYTDDKSTAAAESLKALRGEEAEKLKAFWESQKTAKAVEAAAPVETAANTSSAAPPSPTVKYTDVTAQWLEEATPNSHVVQDAQEYVKDGVTYKVDGHNVKLEYSPHEKEIAELLESKFGGELYMVPRVNNPQGVSTPDYLFRGLAYDLKTIGKTSGKNPLFNRIRKAKKQSNNFVLDITDSNLPDNIVKEQIEKVFTDRQTKNVERIIVIRNGEIEKVYKK